MTRLRYRLQAAVLSLSSDSLIILDGEQISVRGRHARQQPAITEALESFLPAEGLIAITGKRIRVYGHLREAEQGIRNILLISLRLSR
ncbi:MAG: hypothetical protein KDA79_24950 [Planctomycetaceae bacterium]|nr:hypothetical protein [Planctomycetaceae bacterium]